MRNTHSMCNWGSKTNWDIMYMWGGDLYTRSRDLADYCRNSNKWDTMYLWGSDLNTRSQNWKDSCRGSYNWRSVNIWDIISNWNKDLCSSSRVLMD